MSNLFTPLSVGSSTLKTRIAMAPLTRLRSDNQVPPPEAVKYYGDRAQYEGTLIIAEATSIAPAAVGHFNAPGIWSKQQIEAWRKVTTAVHAKKSFIYLQLWAHGRAAIEADLKRVDPTFEVVSSSDVAVDGQGYGKPRPLTIDEIKEYVQWYVQAAKNAVEAGFDGVEIHSANGYLLNQFLQQGVNNRTDEYGGSIENRSRFTLEVVDAIVEAIGADKVGIRFNPWGGLIGIEDEISPIPQYSHVISEIERRARQGKRLSYIHVMEPRVDFKSFEGTYGPVDREANNFVRQIWQGVIIRCGSFGKDNALMEQLSAADDKLVIAIGRLFISNPDVVAKIKEDRPVDMFNRATFYWQPPAPLEVGYTVDYTRDTNRSIL